MARFYPEDLNEIAKAFFAYLVPQGQGEIDPTRSFLRLGKVRGVTLSMATAMLFIRLSGERFQTVASLFLMDTKNVINIVHFMISNISRFFPLLSFRTSTKNGRVFDPARIKLYASSISKLTGLGQGPGCIEFFGFTDGTKVEVSKPGNDIIHRLTGKMPATDPTYNAGYKMQSVTTLGSILPDGSFFDITEINLGRTNDAGMQPDLEKLHIYKNKVTGDYFMSLNDNPESTAATLHGPDFETVYVFGDDGFAKTRRVRTYYTEAEAEAYPAYMTFNRVMRKARVSNENNFAVLKINWGLLGLPHSNRVFDHWVGPSVKSCFLCHNIHNCIYPNEVSQKFGVPPLFLREYLYPEAFSAPSNLPKHFFIIVTKNN